MASTIVTKNSSTASAVPVSGDLTQGELAVNVTDKRLFTKNSGGTVVELGTNPASLALPNGTTNGVAYLNGSKVVTTGSALTFDGTSLGVGSTAATQTLVRPYTGGSYGAIYSGAVTPSGSNFVLSYNATETYLNGNSFAAFTIAGSEGMRLTSTGLGIGTSSPSDILTLAGGSSGSYGLTINNAKEGGGTKAIFQYDRDNALAVVGANTTNGLVFKTLTSGSLTTKATLDSSGNLGLGVTPSAWRSGDVVLDIGSVVSLVSAQSANTRLYNNTYVASGGTNTYKTTAAASYYDQGSGIHRWFNAPSGTAGNTITFTQAMTLDSSGNLLVGTTSSSGRLTINPASNSQYGAWIQSQSSGDVGNAMLVLAKYDNNTTTSQIFAQFRVNSSTLSGYITANGANAATFTSSSDERLKENIVDLPAQLESIMSLRPVEFDYKDGSGHQIGFIAQEMQAVYKDVVARGADDYLMISGWSKTEARLVKAIQEQQAIIEQLKADVAALKGN